MSEKLKNYCVISYGCAASCPDETEQCKYNKHPKKDMPYLCKYQIAIGENYFACTCIEAQKDLHSRSDIAEGEDKSYDCRNLFMP